MAGPNTGLLCDAMERLGLERDEDAQGPPGSGVVYKVTHETLERLRGKTIIVQDGGEITVQ